MQIKRITLISTLLTLPFVIAVEAKDTYNGTIDNILQALHDDFEQPDTIIPHHMSPGRMYYDTLLEKEREHHWTLRFVLHSSFANQGFDQYSQRKPLAAAMFGGEMTIADISLVSKISANNGMRVDNVNPRVPFRLAGPAVSFGGYESDQYLSLIADSNLNAVAESRDFGMDVCTAFSCALGERKRVSCTLGCIIPIRTILHILDINPIGGYFFNESFAGQYVTRSTTLTQFFSDYSSLPDFISRAVLEPKGLSYQPRQRATGFGDTSFFGLLDFAGFFNHFECLQMGMTIVAPTGKVGSQNVIFPASLGNGSVQFDFFANMIFSTRARMFNPAFHVVGNIMPSYKTTQRIPHLITNTMRQQMTLQGMAPNIASNALLYYQLTPPPPFVGYYVDSFSEYDTTVPQFANNALPVTLSRANRVTVGFGNYFYDLFGTGLQLAIFYDIIHKSGDSFCLDKSAQCNPITSMLTNSDLNLEKMYELSSERTHLLSWTLSYQFENLVNINMGSQNVIAGKNVARAQEFFASLIVVF